MKLSNGFTKAVADRQSVAETRNSAYTSASNESFFFLSDPTRRVLPPVCKHALLFSFFSFLSFQRDVLDEFCECARYANFFTLRDVKIDCGESFLIFLV